MMAAAHRPMQRTLKHPDPTFVARAQKLAAEHKRKRCKMAKASKRRNRK